MKIAYASALVLSLVVTTHADDKIVPPLVPGDIEAAGSSDPIYVAPGAIDWLLLEVKGALAGPTGGDKLTHTVFIQRVNTAGGKEPSAGCDASTLNTRKLVAYEADYVFYR